MTHDYQLSDTEAQVIDSFRQQGSVDFTAQSEWSPKSEMPGQQQQQGQQAQTTVVVKPSGQVIRQQTQPSSAASTSEQVGQFDPQAIQRAAQSGDSQPLAQLGLLIARSI